MKNVWKWILGIVIVLVVVAAVGFVARGFFVSHTARVERFDNFRPPMTDGFGRDNWRGPMGGFNRGMPMHGGRGFGGYRYMPLSFMFFGGLLRLIFPLAMLGAVGYFAYKKGKKDGVAAAMSVSAPEIEAMPEPVETPQPKGRKVAKDD